MIRHRCNSGLDGWVSRLRDNYRSEDEFNEFSQTHGLAKRLGFNFDAEAWDENPWIHGSTNPNDFGIHKFPDTYLHVRRCVDGEEWIRPMRGNSLMDLATQIRKWVKEEFCGELFLDGKIQPRLEGDYFGQIITGGRGPDSVVVWDSGGFWLTSESNALMRNK